MPGTVTIACKLPNGLFMETKDKNGVLIGKRQEIRGSAVKFGMPPISIYGGYALTTDVDADLVDRWMAANQNSDLVQKKWIFAYAKSSDAAAQAKEMADEKCGLEPMNPDKPGKGLERVGVGM